LFCGASNSIFNHLNLQFLCDADGKKGFYQYIKYNYFVERLTLFLIIWICSSYMRR